MAGDGPYLHQFLAGPTNPTVDKILRVEMQYSVGSHAGKPSLHLENTSGPLVLGVVMGKGPRLWIKDAAPKLIPTKAMP